MYQSRPSDHQTIRRRSFGQAKTERIGRTLIPIQDRRGPNNEGLVGDILVELKEEGLIRHFFQTEPRSRQDRHGRDFVVICNDSSRIIFQVKSSQRNIEKFVKKIDKFKDNRSYEGIYCVLVKTDYLVDDRPLRKEIKHILRIDE